MSNNISIIGMGNLTQSLLQSLISNNFKGKIFVHDINKRKKKFAIRDKIIFKNSISDLINYSN